MTSPDREPPRPRSGPSFRPEFTLMLVYFFVFFLFFAFVLTVPAQIEAMRTLPATLTDEEKTQALAQVAKQAVTGRLWLALLATIVTLGVGAYTRMLPGLKRRRG